MSVEDGNYQTIVSPSCTCVDTCRSAHAQCLVMLDGVAETNVPGLRKHNPNAKYRLCQIQVHLIKQIKMVFLTRVSYLGN